ncbi:MAG TPA: hypothetical protein VJ203_10375 [Bacteroidales bacterium]|nr:hypothetical protein [Bacteroidales bacterium]
MKTTLILSLVIPWFITFTAIGQEKQEIIVKAGTKIIDYFPLESRFRYHTFTPGKVFFKDGTYTGSRLNYNILYGEVQFIQKNDTLSIANTRDIKFVTIESDTFYFDRGYVEIVLDMGKSKLGLKQYVKMVDKQTQAAYGMTSSVSATDSYNSIPSSSGYYSLTVNEDISVRPVKDYYLGSEKEGFQLIRKKLIFQLFPESEDEIKQYLKNNEVNFNKEEDLMKLCMFLKDLG